MKFVAQAGAPSRADFARWGGDPRALGRRLIKDQHCTKQISESLYPSRGAEQTF